MQLCGQGAHGSRAPSRREPGPARPGPARPADPPFLSVDAFWRACSSFRSAAPAEGERAGVWPCLCACGLCPQPQPCRNAGAGSWQQGHAMHRVSVACVHDCGFWRLAGTHGGDGPGHQPGARCRQGTGPPWPARRWPACRGRQGVPDGCDHAGWDPTSLDQAPATHCVVATGILLVLSNRRLALVSCLARVVCCSRGWETRNEACM